MPSVRTFGVIGYGEFGPVAAQHLAPPGTEVLVFDKNPDRLPVGNARRAGFTAVAGADVIILAVPFDSYESVLPELSDQSKPESLIVDVCSVKMEPTAAFAKHGLLDRANVLMTHPLFGPQSVTDGVIGKELIVTQESGSLAEHLLAMWHQKGIKLTRTSAEEHDREMKRTHALPFFVGAALLKMDIGPSRFNTRYYSELMDLVEVERHHSPQLFDTIQRHNPFAREERERFITTLQQIHDELA